MRSHSKIIVNVWEENVKHETVCLNEIVNEVSLVRRQSAIHLNKTLLGLLRRFNVSIILESRYTTSSATSHYLLDRKDRREGREGREGRGGERKGSGGRFGGGNPGVSHPSPGAAKLFITECKCAHKVRSVYSPYKPTTPDLLQNAHCAFSVAHTLSSCNALQRQRRHRILSLSLFFLHRRHRRQRRQRRQRRHRRHRKQEARIEFRDSLLTACTPYGELLPSKYPFLCVG